MEAAGAERDEEGAEEVAAAAAAGGGVGYLFGALFVGLGAGRLYLLLRR